MSKGLHTIAELTGENFKVFKGYFIGDKGTVFTDKLRPVKSEVFKIKGVSYRKTSLIAEVYGIKPIDQKKKITFIDGNKNNKAISNLRLEKSYTGSYKAYNNRVRSLTKLQPLHLLKDFDKVAFNGSHIDHIIPVKTCFNEKISPEECADISNLQVITGHENTRLKSNKAYCVISQCEHIKNK